MAKKKIESTNEEMVIADDKPVIKEANNKPVNVIFKKLYIGKYGYFEKGKKYELTPELYKLFKDEVEKC